MGPFTYKVFNLYHSKQCGTYSLTLVTTISPSSVSPSILGYAPPQAEAFFIHTLAPPLATLNGTRRLTTFVRKTFDTRSRSNPSSNQALIPIVGAQR
ncbi:hypothetical protein QL285_076451 [Trifolium repens]|nr:hypothetical protein QL285_076451 [Trifolium repens]